MVITMVAMMVALIPSVVLAEGEPLPRAKVENLNVNELDQLDPAPGYPLQAAMKFSALQTEEEAIAAPGNYEDWYVDFFITIEGLEGGKFTADSDCYLAGYYGSYGWVQIPLEYFASEFDEGTYPVMGAVSANLKYGADICGSVKEFICGMHLSEAVLEEHPDLKITLELGMSEEVTDIINGKYKVVPNENGAASSFEFKNNGEGLEYVAPIVAPTNPPAGSATTPDKSPNTGDNTVAPFAVAGLVLAAMAAVVVARRRYN